MFLQTKSIVSFILIFAYVFLFSINTAMGDPSKEVLQPRRLKEIIQKDISRYKGIAQRAKRRPIAKRRMVEVEEPDPPIGEREGPLKSIIEGSVKLPMYAAADYKLGQYIVDMEVGTPPMKVRLIVDTGSDLTWVKCKNHPKGIFTDERGFEVGLSSTFQPISCGGRLCQEEFDDLMAINHCPKPTSPCHYNYTYEDDNGVATCGIFGKETATLPTTKGKTVQLSNILIGCSESYSGKINFKDVDGILGLGVSPYSFSSLAVNKFGGTFSYCLVDHLSPSNQTNYLIFGENREKAPMAEFFRYTSLRVKEMSPFLWVSIKGISMGKRMLDIPPLVWRDEEIGGTILDSGTTVTYWNEQAYLAIMDTLIPALEKDYPKLPSYKGDGRTDFEYCFNSTIKPLDKTKVPRMEIHFTDGARFKPHLKSYIIDDGPDVKCIGFLVAPGGMNIIGNIIQQNYFWEFDLHQGSVGFYPSICN